MRQVDVTADLRAPRETVLDALDPAALVRLEGTYEVDSVRETDDGWIVTAVAEAGSDRVPMTLSVDAVDDGYAYDLVDGGFFAELHTTVLVTDPPAEARQEAGDEDLTRVTIRSTFTFGGRLARVKDWFATSNRRTELRRAIARLGEEVAGEESDTGNESNTGEGSSTDDEDASDGR